jgi:hypothetical protein
VLSDISSFCKITSTRDRQSEHNANTLIKKLVAYNNIHSIQLAAVMIHDLGYVVLQRFIQLRSGQVRGDPWRKLIIPIHANGT